MNLREAIAANSRAVGEMSEPQLRSVLVVLREARDDAARGLAEFLYTHEKDDVYTVHVHRQLLAQLNQAEQVIKNQLQPAAVKDLKAGHALGKVTAAKKLHAQAEAGQRQFAMSTPPLRFDLALVLRDADHVLMHRFASSAQRYAGKVGQQMRQQLSISAIKNESIAQMTRRLLRGGDYAYEATAKRGPEALAEAAAKREFFRSYGDAERLARTELVNAYGEVQVQGLEHANREDPGWLKRWDAANDRKVCSWCYSLNGATAQPEEPFPEGVDHPPLHPCCRCCVVPWRVEWPAWEQYFKAA